MDLKSLPVILLSTLPWILIHLVILLTGSYIIGVFKIPTGLLALLVYALTITIYWVVIEPIVIFVTRLITIIYLTDKNSLQKIKDSEIHQLSWGLYKLLMKTLDSVKTDNLRPDIALKKEMYRGSVRVLSLYPAIQYVRGNLDVSRNVSDVVNNLEKRGREILFNLVPIPIINIMLVVVSVFVIIGGLFDSIYTPSLVILTLFWVREVLYMITLSSVEEGLGEDINFEYHKGMSSSEIRDRNILTVGWNTETLLYESIHTLFRKEGGSDGGTEKGDRREQEEE